MITGITLQAHPTTHQKIVLSQWMGCFRFIWNAKCDENRYLYQFAKKYLPSTTVVPVDQSYSQYKNTELTPWLFDCPSQILRNSASNWYDTYRNFMKGKCGTPKRKRRGDTASVYLTRELFKFEKCSDGVTRLFIGTKTNNIGYLSIKNHDHYGEPNSITIRRENGKYLVSFCYEDGFDETKLKTQEEHFNQFRQYSFEELDEVTVGIDRGISRPVQANESVFDFTEEQKAKKKSKEKYIRRCQRRLSKQKKGSKRRKKTQAKIAKSYNKIKNIRKDFCHKTSRKIVDDKNTKIIILEDLNTSKMTKAPEPKKDEITGKYLKNKAKSKAKLNRSILDMGWYMFELFLKYKAHKADKAVFKILANFTSQECADCGHTHPDNRKTQSEFKCRCCGYSEHADRNAARVIKKRAINLLKNSGTELSKRGVLLDKGRGAIDKTQDANANCASGKETSKKNVKVLVA